MRLLTGVGTPRSVHATPGHVTDALIMPSHASCGSCGAIARAVVLFKCSRPPRHSDRPHPHVGSEVGRKSLPRVLARLDTPVGVDDRTARLVADPAPLEQPGSRRHADSGGACVTGCARPGDSRRPDGDRGPRPRTRRAPRRRPGCRRGSSAAFMMPALGHSPGGGEWNGGALELRGSALTDRPMGRFGPAVLRSLEVSMAERERRVVSGLTPQSHRLSRCCPSVVAGGTASAFRAIWLAVPAGSTSRSFRKSLILNGVGR